MADEAESHYQHLVLNGEISQGEADVLEQLRSISETLKETLILLKTTGDLAKQPPAALRAIELQAESVLNVFKAAMFAVIRSRNEADITITN